MVSTTVPFIMAITITVYNPNFLPVAMLLMVFPLISVVFFRDPERPISSGIACPADGKIIKVEEDRLTIYMGLRNVHVNRSPVSGKIIGIKHIPGSHRPANIGDTSGNEKQIFSIQTQNGVVEVTQIAGVLARRTVSYVKLGDMVQKGQRIGMIRFGSRVDIKFPVKIKITVKHGEAVKAGSTKIGEWI